MQVPLSDLSRSSSSAHLLDLRISLTPDEREAYQDAATLGDPNNHMVVGKVYPHPQRTAEVLRSLLSSGKKDGLYDGVNSVAFGGEEQQHHTFPLQGRFIALSRGVSDEQVSEDG